MTVGADLLGGRMRKEEGGMEMEKEDNSPRLLLPHLHQQGHWDCGITCVQMVLAAYGRRLTTEQLRAVCGTTSIWTADLANILLQLGIPFRFYTVTLGVCPEFANEEFYHTSLRTDEMRVTHLFKDLASYENGSLVQRSVSNQELIDLVKARNFLIALVDANLLPCSVCQVYTSRDPRRRKAYFGHYIVICAYEEERDSLLFLDPRAYHPGYCEASPSAIERTRKAFGTDEDLLVVPDPRVQNRTEVT